MSYVSKPYKIDKIETFTEEVKLFRVKSDLNPKPGQFLEVSIPGIGECPLASCSYSSKYIDLLIKKAGNVTSAMFRLDKNSDIFIRGPYGCGFPLKELEGKNLILVAGGTGIAPITSLIDYIEQNNKRFGEVFIYFGFRNENYLLLKNRMKDWARKFNIVVCLDEKSKNNLNINSEKGFVHEVMAKNVPKLENRVALMCGPEIMMDSVSNLLIKQGLEKNKIYWSMERRMECGIGCCNRCLIQDVYVCRNGPVFRYDIIKPKIDNENSANKEGK